MTKTALRRQYAHVSESHRLAAFDAVYENEFEYVWHTLRRLGVPAADLPDAVHDVFVVVYRRWDEIDPARPIRPWLFGVARRVASGRRRKHREAGQASDPVSPAPPIDDRVASHEILAAALGRLDDDRREVFVLHDIEGHSGQEIARILDAPVNTVHSRLRSARAQLVAAIEDLRGGKR